VSISISARKAKGRKLQQLVKESVQKAYSLHLEEGDIESTGMGQHGMDLKLSPAARKIFPLAVECKNQEKLNIWSALEQSEKNSEGLIPTVVFKRNESKPNIVLKLKDFEKILTVLNEMLTTEQLKQFWTQVQTWED